MSNIPCVGCWWKEGGRCYQDKLADVHGVTKAPSYLNNPIGLEINDELLTACMDREVHARKSHVVTKVISRITTKGHLQ